MKKQSSNKINLPKKKRFSRFFLRRLLICTLAAAIGGAMLLQHSYLKDAENYTSDCSDAWKKKIMWLRSEISQDSDSENITTDEKYIQKYIQTKLNRITTSLDIFTNSPVPYGDHAAMLIDAENLKYYVAQPEIRFHVVDAKNTENPNAERKHRGIIDNSELSEQIETELRDYAKKHYTRYALPCYVYNLIPYPSVTDASSHPVLDAIRAFFNSRFFYVSVPIAVYLADNKVCGAEYGFMNYRTDRSENAIPFVYRQGTVQQEGLQEIRNSAVCLRDGQYVYQKMDDEILPDEAYLDDWQMLGMPQDTESGRAMAETAQNMADYQEKFLELQDKYQKIIDDKSGKLLNEYYKEEEKQISDLYKQYGKNADYVSDYNECVCQVESA